MKVLSYAVLLATPLAYFLDKALGLPVEALLVVLVSVIFGASTYSRTKRRSGDRKRYKIGLALSSVYLILVAVMLLFVLPAMEELSNQILESSEERTTREDSR